MFLYYKRERPNNIWKTVKNPDRFELTIAI